MQCFFLGCVPSMGMRLLKQPEWKNCRKNMWHCLSLRMDRILSDPNSIFPFIFPNNFESNRKLWMRSQESANIYTSNKMLLRDAKPYHILQSQFLMELGEMDCKTCEVDKSLSTQLLNPVRLAPPLSQPFGSGKWEMSKKMLHAGRCHGQGQYKLLPNGGALKILGALQKENVFFLLCQEMTCRQKHCNGFFLLELSSYKPKYVFTSHEHVREMRRSRAETCHAQRRPNRHLPTAGMTKRTAQDVSPPPNCTHTVTLKHHKIP